MSDETTTHACPICGEVHLPKVSDWFQGYQYGRATGNRGTEQRIPWWRRLLWKVGR